MSAVPGFIDALATVFAAALSNVEVNDGPFAQVPDGDYLCVGWSPYITTAADAKQVWSGIGAWGRDETFEVTCYLDSYSGDQGDVKGRRDGAYALLGNVETTLRGNPTVNNTVLSAQLSGHILHVEETEAGVAVGISFTVRVMTVI